MLLRLPDLRDRVIRLLGSENLRTTTEALSDAAKRVSRYLLMQTLINTWQGIWVTAGLWFLGVPNGMLWGALTIVAALHSVHRPLDRGGACPLRSPLQSSMTGTSRCWWWGCSWCSS